MLITGITIIKLVRVRIWHVHKPMDKKDKLSTVYGFLFLIKLVRFFMVDLKEISLLIFSDILL